MTNVVPAPRNQNEMNKVLDEELDGNVMWEEKLLPRNVESVMDTIFIQSDFMQESISTIPYQLREEKYRSACVHTCCQGCGWHVAIG